MNATGSTACRLGFLAKYSALWAERAAAHRVSGNRVDIVIADALDRIVDGMRRELAAMPVAAIAASTAVVDKSDTSWSAAIFHAGGRFNPFAGTHADQMLASAKTCERLGYADLAARYRAHAAQDADDGPQNTVVEGPRRGPPSRRCRPIWSGPNITPPEPAAFVAGHQLGLFV